MLFRSGVGLSGLLPSYVLVIRECYTIQECNWRVPTVLFAGFLGMATGGWAPGWLFDRYASYGPAFDIGMAFNIANIAVLLFLVGRKHNPFRAIVSDRRSAPV